jgi:hypothetical protein
VFTREGTKYDDAGWHIGGDFPPDQPEENGFVHMAAYLAWIARRGWLNPAVANPVDLQPALDREPGAAVRLMESMDGKLVDELMTDEAAQFSDYYYADGYLADWAAEFADLPAYGVSDIPRTHERIQRRLDTRYDEWVRMDRPRQWRQPRPERVASALHQIRFYLILFGAIALVALVGAVLDLRGFPWPLIQLAVVGIVLFLLVRSEIGSGR